MRHLILISVLICTSFHLEVIAARGSKKTTKVKTVLPQAAIRSERPVVLSKISLTKKTAGLFSVCVDYFYPKNSSEAKLNYSGMGSACWNDTPVAPKQQVEYQKCFQRLQLEFRKQVEARPSATIAFVEKTFKSIGKTYRNCSQSIDLSGPWPMPKSYVMVHSDLR